MFSTRQGGILVMTPRFREDKTTQAAAILIGLSEGTINYMKLVKLLYLVDREALNRWGQPVTFDDYFSMDHGPVLSRTLDLINEGARPGRSSYWHEHISPPEDYFVTLLRSAGTDKLSDAEIDLIREVHEQCGHMDKWELVDLLHEMLPEWIDPQGSSAPIAYEDILTAVGKDESEVRCIRNELDLIAYVDERLSDETL